MLYKITLVFLIYIWYLYVKSLIMKALSICLSLRVFVFLVFEQVFVFAPAHKWNLYYTTEDSPYVCRQVLRL